MVACVMLSGALTWRCLDCGHWEARDDLWPGEAPDREQSREEMRQILVGWNAPQLEQLQEVANAILDDRGATVANPEEQEAGWSRGEHEAEVRAVEAHQEAKHGDA
jgi:hypothetical protein